MAAGQQRGARWLRRRRLKIGLLLGCAVVFTAITLAAKGSGGLDRIELNSIDARFAVRGTQKPPKDVVVVAIDDVSFEDLHLRFQDWPRTFHARVLRNLAKAKPKAVIFDVQITEPARDGNEDLALYNAAGVARPVIFATTEVDADGGTGVFGNTAKRSADNLAAIGAKAAHGLFPVDAGGVIRRMDYSIKKLPTVGITTAATVTKRPVPAPSGRTGSELIDYAGPPGTVDTVSYSKVYEGSIPASRFRGKVVVVGPTAPSLQDVHATSAGGGADAGRRDPGQRVSRRRAPASRCAAPASTLDTSCSSSSSGCSRRCGRCASRLLRVAARSSAWSPRRLPRRRPARVRQRHGAASSPRRCWRWRSTTGRHPRRRRSSPRRASGAPARDVRALRPRGRRRPGPGRRRRRAPRRRARRGDGHVQRPARLHALLRDARAGAGHRVAQPLPDAR